MRGVTKLASVLAVFVLCGCESHTPSQQVPSQPAVDRISSAPKTPIVPSLKEVQLGESLAQVAATYKSAKCYDVKIHSVTKACTVDGITYADVKGELSIFFAEDKVVSVAVNGLEPRDFSLIVSSMESRFGPAPTGTAKSKMVGDDDVAWEGKTWLLTASPTSGSDTEHASVSLMTKDSLNESIRSAASDL